MATKKSTTAKKSGAGKVSAETAASVAVVDASDDTDPQMIRKKDIYDQVTIDTGLRKREVREAVDAALAYLHSCLSDGKEVQCPPLGKIRVINRGEGDEAKVLYRVNLQKPGTGKKDEDEAQEALEAVED